MKLIGWLAASALVATACSSSASTGAVNNGQPQPQPAASTPSSSGFGATHRQLPVVPHLTSSAGSATPGPTAGHSHASTQTHTGTDAAAGPKPVLPGTYTYDQTGSQTVAGVTSKFQPHGTLQVEPATSSGRQTSHMTVDSKQPPSTQTLLFNRHGMFLLSEAMQVNFVGKHSVTCHFHPGVPYPPWPVRVGATVHAHARCGQISATATGHVTAKKSATIGGTPLTIFVITTTLVTSGEVRSTSTDTSWFAPSLRLSVADTGTTTGSFGPFRFTSRFSRTLVSTRPS